MRAGEQQSPPGISARSLGFGGKEILTEEHVFCAVAIKVGDNHGKGWSELSFGGELDGVEMVAPLKKLPGPGGNTIGVVCFRDPDGTVLELLSGM